MKYKNKDICLGMKRVVVEESISKEACPICNLISELEIKTIKDILYEYVNDSGVRSKFRESLGLCPYHAWLMVRIVSEPEVFDGLGATIIYEDMLSTYLKKLTKDPGYSIKGKCFICKYSSDFESFYLRDFIDCISNNREFLEKYISSRSILCSKHFKTVYSSLKDVEIKDILLESRIKKIKDVLKDMENFIRKHDYRIKDNITEDESKAWIKAIMILKGGYNSLNLVNQKVKYS